MAMSPTKTPPCLIVDASVLIALCAREPDKYALADSELTRYANAGFEFYAPGVIIAESLYVLCNKRKDSQLSASAQSNAIDDIVAYMDVINSPPGGDKSLIVRAEQIRSGYGCSRSADGLYIALAEELAAKGTAGLLTFDSKMESQSKLVAPTVVVQLLTRSPVPTPPPPHSPPVHPPPAS